MAEQLSKVTSIQNKRKYCCDPFKVHKTRRTKDLRFVTAEQAKCNPSLVQVGMKICTNCRKQLQKPQCMVEEELPIENLHSEGEDDFVPPEIEVENLNETLELIGESPLSQQKVKSRSRYLPQKKKKVQDALERKFDAACGSSPSLSMDVSSDEEDGMPGEIVQKLIAKFHSTESRSEKITVLTIFAQTWSRRKIMSKFGCSQRMATQAKHLSFEKGILATPNPKTGKKLPENVTAAVEMFYRQDDISRVMPGKKDCLSILRDGNKTLFQKRLVLGNLKEIYQTFKSQHPSMKISFSKFAMLRPKECVLAGASGTHSVCVCTIHNNVKLMMNGSMMASVTANEEVPVSHYGHALAKMMCNPSLPKCHLGECPCCPGKQPLREMLLKCYEESDVDEVEFKQWTSTDRSKLETMVEPLEDFVESFLEKLENLKRHDFIAKQQSQYLNKRKEGLVEGEVLVIGDFSENFSFVVQDEAQSFHWNNSMATLHPFVYYFKQDGEVNHNNFVLISDCHTHDTVAVHLFQRELMRHLSEKFQVLKAVIYFSDGCAGQYKNLKNFCNLCLHEYDFGVPAEWHFFATSHGKGPSDGIGGTIKREATKASLQRPYHDQILSPLKLFQFVDSHLKGINAKFVTTADWYSEEEILRERFQSAKTIAGTQKLHCFKPISKHSLRVSEYSDSEETREVSIVKAGCGHIELSKITGYVAVVYDSEWWVAYVSSIQPGTNEVTISFLHPHGPNPSFVYPDPPEELVVDVSDILVHLDPVTVTGRTYTLSKEESQAASTSLRNRLQMK